MRNHQIMVSPDILVQHKQETRIDSRVISERAGIQHESLIATIKKHQQQLRELGTLPRQSLKEFPDFKSGKSGRKRGRPEISYLLNEMQLDYILRIVRGRDTERMNCFKLDVTKAFAKRRAAEPVRREYLPSYHESRESLKALGAQRHHYINLARAENRLAGLSVGERGSAGEHQISLLVVMQKIEQAAFEEAIQNGMTPTEAVREVARRMEAFASLMTPSPVLGAIMRNTLTIAERKSAPLPERLSEQLSLTSCAILPASYGANYTAHIAQNEGADRRSYRTQPIWNFVLKNDVGQRGRKAKNSAGGAVEVIISGCPVAINYSCSLVLRRWRRLSSCSTFSGKNPACLFSGADDFVSGCFSVIHQPFGSIPRCCSSLRSIRLIHVAKDESPSLRISSSSWARKSSGKRIWYWGDFFRFCIDTCNYPNYYFSVITRVVTFERKSNAPKCLEPLPRRLTTNDRKSIEVAMRNHTTPVIGRDLHNLNKFTWRFIALSAAKPRVIHIEATSEQEARQQSPAGCVMVFTARLPVREVRP